VPAATSLFEGQPPDPWQLVIAQIAIPGIAIFAAIGATLKVFYNKVRRDLYIMMAGRRRTTSSFAVSAIRRADHPERPRLEKIAACRHRSHRSYDQRARPARN
jgi:hypothetical protein